MAKGIYCLKIYLYRKQLKWLRNHLERLKRIIKFILKFYLKAWYTCKSAIRAPFDDLTLLQEIHKFESTDNVISNAAFDSLSRHLWYLSEPLVSLSFFDHRVDDEEKREMIKALEKDSSSDYEKRITIDKNSVSEEKMHKFVTKNTRKFLEDFGVNIDWLQIDPELWPTDENYKNARNYFQKLNVVNDSAERNLRLVDTFNQSFKSEDEFQQLLQIVEKHRREYPNAKKSTLLRTNLEKKDKLPKSNQNQTFSNTIKIIPLSR